MGFSTAVSAAGGLSVCFAVPVYGTDSNASAAMMVTTLRIAQVSDLWCVQGMPTLNAP